MKKKVLIGFFFILFCVVVCVLLSFSFVKKEQSFFLEEKYYGNSEMTELTLDELNHLIEEKESFALFVYQPMCMTSADFEIVLKEFLEEKQIRILKIAFLTIKEEQDFQFVKYYPSFILYNKGKKIDFLEADKNEDVNCFTSKEGFSNWFTQYVKLKEVPLENKTTEENTVKEEETISKDVQLDSVKREENKVNIYFFWGQGCPHCEKEFQFFEKIKEEYGQYYNLYAYETWKHKENAELLSIFAKAMNDKVTGVPYTIIGNQSFKGFNEQKEKLFLEAIQSQYKNSEDIYFDKIKK